MPHHHTNLTFNATNPQLPPSADVEQGQQPHSHDPQRQQLLQDGNALPAPDAQPRDGGCRQIHRGWHVMKGVGYLLLLLVYHGFCFAGFLSLAIGIAMLCSFLCELISSYPLDPYMQSGITICFLITFGEIHVLEQSEGRMGAWISRKVAQYPVILGMFLRAIFVGLYFAALSQLYPQYLAVHPVTTPWWLPTASENIGRNMSGSKLELDTSRSVEGSSLLKRMNQATFLFMLSISYMLYITVRSSDYVYYRSAHPKFYRRKEWKCCTYLKHIGIQLLIPLVYLVLIVLTCLVCHALFLPPDITFVIIILICVVIGVCAVHIESRRPFPVVPQQPPNYEFEMYLSAKSTIAPCLSPGILLTFYLSNNESTDSHQQAIHDELRFLAYTTFIGLLLIGSIKLSLNVYYSKELIFWVEPARPRRRPRTPTPVRPMTPAQDMEHVADMNRNLTEPTTSENGSIALVKTEELEKMVEEINVRMQVQVQCKPTERTPTQNQEAFTTHPFSPDQSVSVSDSAQQNFLPEQLPSAINEINASSESNNNVESTEQSVPVTTSPPTILSEDDDKTNMNASET